MSQSWVAPVFRLPVRLMAYQPGNVVRGPHLNTRLLRDIGRLTAQFRQAALVPSALLPSSVLP